MAPRPLPPTTARSAPAASPGPFTTHPITATFNDDLTSAKISSTSLVSFKRSTSKRPHPGQAVSIGPCERISSALSISYPTRTSSALSGVVRDTRTVSPIPWDNNAPIPIDDLTVPLHDVPDSVTPRCSG